MLKQSLSTHLNSVNRHKFWCPMCEYEATWKKGEMFKCSKHDYEVNGKNNLLTHLKPVYCIHKRKVSVFRV